MQIDCSSYCVANGRVRRLSCGSVKARSLVNTLPANKKTLLYVSSLSSLSHRHGLSRLTSRPIHSLLIKNRFMEHRTGALIKHQNLCYVMSQVKMLVVRRKCRYQNAGGGIFRDVDKFENRRKFCKNRRKGHRGHEQPQDARGGG